VPRAKPEGFSINVRCLDNGTVRVTRVIQFDGEHWEESMARLAQAAKT
jgi:centromere protein V